MSVQKIGELLALMQEHDIVELELEEGDFSVALRKQGAFAPPPAPMAHAMPAAMPVAAPASVPAAPAPPVEDDSLTQVKSPIVGTFYRAPSPESPPFVDIGAKVGKDTVVCIIEAMKIMNEIKAEADGVIEKVLVESGEPVEYGQPLFLIRRPGA
ncbi:MAG: acetyl-CoA carboxylase biotin carboxyl carrier protein [Planctomycetota bacterium]|jgi:acetyl-CoA carboxylase biotin carboxyl carrier protein|nr:acetyl-CoA carboxylase biotin carboxyl carrier protein [Planctomycetota bacterium]